MRDPAAGTIADSVLELPVGQQTVIKNREVYELETLLRQ